MSREVLQPRAASKYVAETSEFVTIKQSGVDKLTEQLLDCMKSSPYSVSNWKKHTLHPKVADEAALEWIFVADLLNFSFWPDHGTDKFNVMYRDQEYTGYWSLCAIINRAIEQKVPLTSAAYYSRVKVHTMEILCRSQNESRIPLLEQRTRILNDSGKILIEKFGGAFSNVVKQANGSAVRLLQLIVENFPSFRDEANYKGKRLAFYKRAQILVADVWACFEGKGLASFTDIDEITMFADYRIPQALVYFGVLAYSDKLMERLKKGELLPSGSAEEVEIRGNAIWAVELIAEKLKQSCKVDNNAVNNSMNAVLIDYYLWNYRRLYAKAMEHIPFHRTRCIYY